jgi:hypothetical protein
MQYFIRNMQVCLRYLSVHAQIQCLFSYHNQTESQYDRQYRCELKSVLATTVAVEKQ